MKRTYRRSLAVMLAVSMVALSAGRAQAALAPPTTPGEAAVRTQDIETVQAFLEQKSVAQHLAGLNLSAPEIESRLGQLSDQELHQVATRIHQQQPGGHGAGVVVTVLVIGVLALLFVYLLKRV